MRFLYKKLLRKQISNADCRVKEKKCSKVDVLHDKEYKYKSYSFVKYICTK